MPKSRNSLLGLFSFLFLSTFLTFSCHNGSSGIDIASGSVTGAVAVTLSDPPICKFPDGDFNHVWVTVVKVTAHISANAADNAKGWVTLLDLADAPQQIDLLSAQDTDCVLATLGATTGLPVGDYQQIRLYLLGNNSNPTTVSNNACAALNSFNCVDSMQDGLQVLELNSQEKSGLKIPPGQIAGGAISLKSGEAADINIDFDACRSIVRTGTGTYRLKPTLNAGQVSLQQNMLTGRVVDNQTGNPIVGGQIIVTAQKPDSSGVNRIILQTMADATDGTFSLCPLPEPNYDLVITGRDALGNMYHATIVFDLTIGEQLGDIPLEPNSANGSPGELTGLITTTDASQNPISANIQISVLQEITPSGGSLHTVTIPAFGTSLFATEVSGTCPTGTQCANYLAMVPGVNPILVQFDAQGVATITFLPATDPTYELEAMAFNLATGQATCSPSSLLGDMDSVGGSLTVMPGQMVVVEDLDFVDCVDN